MKEKDMRKDESKKINERMKERDKIKKKEIMIKKIKERMKKQDKRKNYIKIYKKK